MPKARQVKSAAQVKELEKRLRQSKQAIPGVLVFGAIVLLLLVVAELIWTVPWPLYPLLLWVVPFGLIGDGINIVVINRKLTALRSRMEYEEELRERARQARMKRWSFERWSPTPALVTRTDEGTVVEKFTGQEYDAENTEVNEDGWDHDHCIFCWQSICTCGSENCLPEGYTDGDDWICSSCYTKLIENGEEPEADRGGT